MRSGPPTIAHRRLRAQRLAGPQVDGPIDAVRQLLAVQAQDHAGAKWAVAQRTAGATDHDLDRLFDEGSLIRTHVLRPTWHLIAPEDLRWLLDLTAARVRATTASYFRRLELDDALLGASRDVLRAALEGGRAITRSEVAAAYAAAGIEADALRRSFLLMDAELAAVVCSGPRRGKQHTFMLVDERVPPSPARSRDEGLAEIARRYVDGHGPAQAGDLAWWSGLTMADARAGLELAGTALVRETVGDRTFWVSASEPAADGGSNGDPLVHLLPNYDELLIAFRDRSDAADPGLPADARVSETLLAHIIVRRGLVVGGWRSRTGRTSVDLTPDLLVPFGEAGRIALRAAADRLAAFVGQPVVLGGD